MCIPWSQKADTYLYRFAIKNFINSVGMAQRLT
jgi:hypothetical protein